MGCIELLDIPAATNRNRACIARRNQVAKKPCTRRNLDLDISSSITDKFFPGCDQATQQRKLVVVVLNQVLTQAATYR